MKKPFVDITFFRPKRTKCAQSEVEVCSLRFFVTESVCGQIRPIVIAYERIHKIPLRRESLIVDFIEMQRCHSFRISIVSFVRNCFHKALDREIQCSQYVSDAQTYTSMEVSELSTLYTHGLHKITSMSIDVPTCAPSLLCHRTSFPIQPTTILRMDV